MKTVDIEQMNYQVATKAFSDVVDKVRELVEYSAVNGKRLPRVQIFPDDFNRLCGAIRRKYAKDAREAAKVAGVRGAARAQEFPPETFDALSFRGIPVECGVRCSKPVKV